MFTLLHCVKNMGFSLIRSRKFFPNRKRAISYEKGKYFVNLRKIGRFFVVISEILGNIFKKGDCKNYRNFFYIQIWKYTFPTKLTIFPIIIQFWTLSQQNENSFTVFVFFPLKLRMTVLFLQSWQFFPIHVEFFIFYLGFYSNKNENLLTNFGIFFN